MCFEGGRGECVCGGGGELGGTSFTSFLVLGTGVVIDKNSSSPNTSS